MRKKIRPEFYRTWIGLKQFFTISDHCLPWKKNILLAVFGNLIKLIVQETNWYAKNLLKIAKTLM